MNGRNCWESYNVITDSVVLVCRGYGAPEAQFDLGSLIVVMAIVGAVVWISRQR